MGTGNEQTFICRCRWTRTEELEKIPLSEMQFGGQEATIEGLRVVLFDLQERVKVLEAAEEARKEKEKEAAIRRRADKFGKHKSAYDLSGRKK